MIDLTVGRSFLLYRGHIIYFIACTIKISFDIMLMIIVIQGAYEHNHLHSKQLLNGKTKFFTDRC